MADRYWVGGTASWDGTAGTKWATTSGGTGGASVPTTADDVFFDALSTGTCTIATGNTGAKSINCTGFTGTITGTAAITVAGSVTLVAGMTYTHTGTITFTGTGTLTTAGKTFSAVTVNGSGITLTLGDALNIQNRQLSILDGVFNTANYSVTAGTLVSQSSNTRTINLGSSTLTLALTAVVTFSDTGTLTFNAGTSQINCSNASASVQGFGKTFYNVSFTSTAVGTRSISGANTFNNLTLTASAAGMSQLSINGNQTVNGTFTCAGSSATQRGFVRSDTIGTTRTLTCAAVSADDCDFRDITIAGAAAPISPTRGGDCGGNSGITFPAAKTVYRVGTGTSWAAASWSNTSGGAGDNSTNFPLPQDTIVIDNATTLTGTLSLFSFNIGTLDCSTRTTGITLNFNTVANRYGSLTIGSGVTVSGTSTQTFSGRSTMVFTSAGKTITFSISVDAPSGTFRLGDAYNASNAMELLRGTFDAFNYNLTCTTFGSSNSNTRTLTMGSGLWTLSSTGTVWNSVTTTSLTFNKDTADILLSNTTTTARTFAGGGLTYNKLTLGGATGTSTTTITGTGNSFTEFASSKTVAHTVRFGNNQGTIDTWSITGTVGNVVTVDSSSAGTRRTFGLTNVTSGIDYLSVKDIGVTQANRFYVGANSTDGGNNLNVIFTAAPSGAQTLTPSLFTNTNTFYLTTITQTGPPQSLLPSLYSNVNTFYEATVTASNTLAPDRYDNTNVFYAATVAASNAIAPARYDNTNVFYAATVTATGADQSLTPSLFTNTQVFYSPVATGYNNLLPTLKDSDNFIYAVSITATNNLAASLFTNTQVFYSPVATTLNTLSPPMFADSDFVFPPTVTAIGATQNLSASLFTNVSVIFAPTVSSAQPQPILGGGSLVRPRRKFRPAILLDIPEPEIVLPDVDAKVILAGLSVTVQLGSVVATSPDPINDRASLAFTQIEAYTSTMTARSSWNDPSDEELLFILDFALD